MIGKFLEGKDVMSTKVRSELGSVMKLSLVMLVVVVSLFSGTAGAQSSDEKIDQLQKTVEALTKKLEAMEARQDVVTNRLAAGQDKFDVLSSQVDEIKSAPATGGYPLFEFSSRLR